MSPDLRRVQSVFLAAVGCEDPEEQACVLDRECADDPGLRERVEALLRAHDGRYSLLDRPLVGRDDLDVGSDSSHEFTGRHVPSRSSRSDPSALTRGAGVTSLGIPSTRTAIPGYEIVGELGRGGMGVVYQARQVLLDRPCALKMILGGAYAAPEAFSRFLTEAQAVARLHHPNIVQIRHIGEVDGLPYIELEYLEGGSLDRQLEGTPWPSRLAATLVASLARGIAEAHRAGIVHRDLKPGNILMAAGGTPKITDFGLAKALGADSDLTATESILGSPSYMAPEQALGKTREVGPPADIHALGAILYELIVGRPPFRGASALETIEQVRSVEPVPPRRLVPGLPRDIETIVMTCLQKQPARRYATADALAEDLRRFLADEPIAARPVGTLERAWRWCRRHPAPAALTAAVVLVAALGVAGILWQWREAVTARDLASRRALAEADARRTAQAARAEAEATLVDMYATTGIQAGDQGDNARGTLWFANAARLARDDPERRVVNAIRARTWGRASFSPLRALVADGTWPGGIAFHPDGRHLITTTVLDGATRDARHLLWDLDAERSVPFLSGVDAAPAAAWSPDGRAMAVGLPDGDVILTGFPDGRGTIRIRFPGRIRHLTYSADGRFLAIAGGNTARVWDVRARAFATPWLRHLSDVTSLAFHPSGNRLATGCRDQRARLFAVPAESARPLWPPLPHRQEVSEGVWVRWFCSPPVFADGGRVLITYEGKEGLTWRATETGEKIRSLVEPDLSGRLAAIVPSPDGRYLAAFGRELPATIRIFEAATGRPLGRVLEHRNAVTDATFSPDGRMLLSCSSDNTAQLWAVPGGDPLDPPLDLHRPGRVVAFAPDGRSLATQDGDLVRLWALPEGGVPTTLVPLDGDGSFAALSPDGTLAIPTGMSYNRKLRSTRVTQVATGRPAGPPLRPGGRIIDAVFSPDGRTVAAATARDGTPEEGQEVVTWDWARDRPIWRAMLPSDPRSLAYRPDGRRLAVLCGEGELLILDPESGRETLRWRAHDAELARHWINNGAVRFSPDGRCVLTWGMGNDVRVWQADTGRLRYPPLTHRDKCHDLQFSADGRSMALASYDGSVRVRDLETGTVLADLPAHPDIVYSAGFSPDGRLLVTACRDRMVRVWDWRAGRLACPPFEHLRETTAAAFTPDGRWVVSASDDGTARAWDSRTGKPVTPPLKTRGSPLSIAVTPDGRRAVLGGFLDALVALDLNALKPDDVDPDDLCLAAELLAGRRIHEGGGTANLSADEWLERWRIHRRRSLGDSRVMTPSRLAAGYEPPAASAAIDASLGAPPEANIDQAAIERRFAEAADRMSRGRFSEASDEGRRLAPLVRRAVDANPDDPGPRYHLALALALAGDHQGSRLACADTLRWFSRLEHPLILDAARSCLVEPDAAADLSEPLRWAETARTRNPGLAWNHYVAGLAAFRAGRYERAAELAQTSLRRGTGWVAAPLNLPVLAMAHHRLGNRDEARRWLERAHGRIGDAYARRTVAHLVSSGIWWDRVEFLLLLHQADAMILDPAFPSRPFSP
ncbi:WD40 repeat domain-containing serine/threonine protein kinase [Aquisphaera insulae]|uniref:WD40 repeat domain-containing serine/threonine protein kinase n=1 Tax=Aquisphaera insulae TaxID=2712864 RepID=UPI0013EA92DB|nr:protein kinase [Aquisphaera insulae]